MSNSNTLDFIDIAVDSLNKINEELCGDHVEITHNEYSKIIVLSDGLGSGVKANILSTLTSNIASTMLRLGSDIFEVLETLEKTLPVCKVRGLAYSTFTIIQIFNDKRIYIVEFDNPRVVYIRDGELLKLNETELKFKDKKIIEYTTTYQNGDLISCFSDGVIHTGIGKHIYLGWQWDEVVRVLKNKSTRAKTSKEISKDIIDICNVFSDYEPGDDTTCLVVKIRDVEKVTLFSGPPKDYDFDREVVTDLMKSTGKKVVCGGTAANICARELNEEIETNFDFTFPNIPPYAKIKGIDLVTEGVLTINETINILEDFLKGDFDKSRLLHDNGAAKLANILIKECTHLDVLIGNSINPAHQNPFFPDDLNIKWKSTQGLIEVVKKLGKEVNVVKY
jgi:hypothetical protein